MNKARTTNVNLKTESSLSHSSEDLFIMVNCIGAPLLIVDEQCERVQHANQCARDFFLIDQASGTLLRNIVGEEANKVLAQVWIRSVEGTPGEPFLIRTTIGGQDRLLVVRVTRLLVDGKLARLLTFADAPPDGSMAFVSWQDSMMEILNWIPFGFEISDNEDSIQFANAYCKELFGYGQQHLETPEDWWRLAYPDPVYRAHAKDKWEQEISTARHEHREMTPFELNVTTLSGECRTIQFRHRTIGKFNINLYLDFTKERSFQQELQRLAETDSLTGIMNRRRFFDVASQFFGEPTEPGLAILMLDIDNFKSINDQHGHAGGDLVLQEFSRRCLEKLRTGDHFSRFGGEEFAVLLPATSMAEAATIAEALRLKVNDQPFFLPATDRRVTVSIGGTWRGPGDTIDTMLARADNALYSAKRSGRNKVVLE